MPYESAARPAAASTELPGVGRCLRAAILDFYYHSIRFVPANLVWGGALLVILALGLLFHPLIALALVPLLAVPLTGVTALAALAARDRDVILSDAWAAYRRHAPVAIAAGGLIVLACVVLATNVIAGLSSGGPLGWAVATMAGWGLVILSIGSPPFWALLVDPHRSGWTTRDVARLTWLVLLAYPGRSLALGIVVGAVLLVSTVLFAALLTISVAFAMVATARTTYPGADRVTAAMPNRFPPLADRAGS